MRKTCLAVLLLMPWALSCQPDERGVVIEDAEVFLLGRSVHVVAHVLVRNETDETVTLTPSV